MAQILLDQRGLCCYCMLPITADASKVEHWLPQDGSSTDLEWGNLLGACKGNEGRPYSERHCDTAKENRAIAISPLTITEGAITYTNNGRIDSTNPAWSHDLNAVLRLNIPKLTRGRNESLAGLFQAMGRTGREWTRRQLEREIRRLQEVAEPPAFVGFLLWMLRKRLGRCAA